MLVGMKPLLILCLVVLVLAAVVFYGLRIRRAMVNTVPLHVTANGFPTEYVVGDPAKPALTYVALGDSTTYGVGASTLEHTYPYGVAQALADAGYFVHVRNLGRSGARLDEVAGVQLPKVLDRPDVVSVSIGGNDATHLTQPSRYRQLVAELLAALTQRAIPMVLVTSTTDMKLTPSIPPLANTVVGLYAERQNREMRPAVEAAGFAYVNLFQDGKLDRPELYASDEFHPSDLGYAKWRPIFGTAVAAQLPKLKQE